ncbi:MAG: DUF4238 domain-containing protein [Candidatus Eisenbacteria sp.]|nr:DUF4238 domain-containing protein [Candidatus Eisenbacteria bacterium]
MARHHYIPRFYLEGFIDPASTGKPKVCPYLWCTDLRTGAIRRRSPANTAKIAGFYDWDGLPDGQLTLEEIYQQSETRAAPVIKRLAAVNLDYSVKDKFNLTMFMAFQLTRVPGFRKLVKIGLEKHFAEETRRYLDNDTWLRKSLEDYRKAYPEKARGLSTASIRESFRTGRVRGVPNRPLVFANTIHNALVLAPAVFATRWTLFTTEATGGSGFMTADQPVCLRFPGARRTPIDSEKAENPDLEISFPISPSVLLVAHQHNEWPKSRRVAASEAANINCGMLPVVEKYVFSSHERLGRTSLLMWSHLQRNVANTHVQLEG